LKIAVAVVVVAEVVEGMSLQIAAVAALAVATDTY